MARSRFSPPVRRAERHQGHAAAMGRAPRPEHFAHAARRPRLWTTAALAAQLRAAPETVLDLVDNPSVTDGQAAWVVTRVAERLRGFSTRDDTELRRRSVRAARIVAEERGGEAIAIDVRCFGDIETNDDPTMIGMVTAVSWSYSDVMGDSFDQAASMAHLPALMNDRPLEAEVRRVLGTPDHWPERNDVTVASTTVSTTSLTASRGLQHLMSVALLRPDASGFLESWRLLASIDGQSAVRAVLGAPDHARAGLTPGDLAPLFQSAHGSVRSDAVRLLGMLESR